MGTIKDRNCIDLIEAENIKKRWQECTEELYKKDLHDPDNHDGVITHLQPGILKCEVNLALGTKLVEVMEFQLSYFKDDDVKVLHSICQQIQQWPQDWKRSVFISIPKRAMPKDI